ncbi:alpha/beta fold hydrolase [Marinobacterium arenosum]|uniref:alpha/beta fold hydrolase n=1 Tax=Marinobacterium arenosum TaxID=2862496 RepID=UPI001C9791CB|nr:alpha/beta hydrolase [Marinobacterium arenosum]MBY4677983.1 alpha/beta fold hydrolase [Marinobacterium arenosum]
MHPDLQHLYDNQMARLPQPVRGYDLKFGDWRTHVVEAGDPQAPPLLAIHGMHTPAPFNLEMVWPLVERYRLISPDLPGQTGGSEGPAPTTQPGDYGGWLLALMDRLSLERCPMVGISFGGAVLLDTAALAPQRVAASALIVPAGLDISLWRPLRAVALNWLRHRVQNNHNSFRRMMAELMAEPWPALEQFYRQVLLHAESPVLLPPGPLNPDQLADWSAPVQLVICSQDIYFEPQRLRQQARLLLPGLQQVVELDDTHIPGLYHRLLIQQQVKAFLERYDEPG